VDTLNLDCFDNSPPLGFEAADFSTLGFLLHGGRNEVAQVRRQHDFLQSTATLESPDFVLIRVLFSSSHYPYGNASRGGW
jgi:hypothetical protein